MTNDDFPDKPSIQTVLWERAKNPLLFFVVLLVSMLALWWVQKVKEDFDKRQKAPLLLTAAVPPPPDSKTDPSPEQKRLFHYVKAARGGDLIAAIENTAVRRTQPDENDSQNKQIIAEGREIEEIKGELKKLIEESVNEIQYQNFRSHDELIIALNNVVSGKRTLDFKSKEKQLNKFYQSESELYAIKAVALSDLNKLPEAFKDYKAGELIEILTPALPKDVASRKTTGTPRKQDSPNSKPELSPSGPAKVDQLQKTRDKQAAADLLGKNSELTAAISYVIGNSTTTGDKLPEDQAMEAIARRVGNYFDEKIINVARQRQQFETGIERVGEKYQSVFESIYKTLKNGKEPVFNLYVDGKKSDPPDPAPLLNWRSLFLDEKSAFVAVYKLLAVTLTAIFVFALVYLILIPLNQIFFLTTYTSSLSEQAKSFLVKKEPQASSEGLARAALATITAIGIGTAVIVANPATSPFGAGTASDDLDDAANFGSQVANPGIANPRNFRNSYPRFIFPTGGTDTGLTDETVTDLVANVSELNENLFSLKNAINEYRPQIETGTVVVRPEFSPEIKDAIADIQQNVSKINTGEIAGNVNGLNTTLDEKLGVPTNPESIIGGLNRISEIIGGNPEASSSATNLLGAIDNLNKNLKDLNDKTLKDVSSNIKTQTDDIGNRIKDNTNQTTTSIDAINQTTTDLVGNELGKNGRNFQTKLKTLFTGERYLVTDAAYTALIKIIPDSTEQLKALRNGLENLSTNRSAGLLTKEDLMNHLKASPYNVSEQTLKNWRRLILRVTRVQR